jgi:hypothetical protein
MHNPAWWLPRLLKRSAAVFVVAVLAVTPFLDSGVARAQGSGIAGSGSAEAAVATMGPGASVVPKFYAQPPTPSANDLAAVRAALSKSYRSGPTNLPHAVNRAEPGGPGPATSLYGGNANPTDFIKGKWQVNVPGGQYSGVGEPSGDNAGLKRFQTGNWYAGLSADGGTTWSFLDPFSLFGSGFCCDQVAVYDPGRNWWFWLLQYGDHLTLANTKDFNSFCYYTFNSSSFGFTGDLDYNDLAVTTNEIYIVSNIFPSGGGMGSVVARLPIDAMISCGSIGFNYFAHTDLGFTYKPVSNGGDVLYWGTDWFGTLGSSFRVFKWQENSGTIFWQDSTLSTTFAFFTRNSGQFCGSPDTVVKNWCQYADSRVLGGALYTTPDGTREIVFSVNAGQGGPFKLPYPYTERIHFRESDRTYLYSDRTFSSSTAFGFGSIVSDARGHQGVTMTFGGGTGDSYPGILVVLIDDVAPTQPWTYNFAVSGAGNPCTSGGLYRWGDYTSMRPYRPADLAFLAYNFVLTANAGDCGFTAPVAAYEVGFARVRDARSTSRWQ